MGLAFTLLYVVLQFFSVAEIEFLRGTSIMTILSILAALGSLMPLASGSRYIINRQFLLMVLFTGWVVVSLVPQGWLGSVIKVFLTFFPSAILFFLVAINMRSLGNLKILRFAMWSLLVYLMIHGIYQYSENKGETTPFVLVQRVENAEPVARLRALGILNDPNEFSQFLLAWIPMLLLTGKRNKGPQASYALKLPIIALVAVCIVLSHSRGALIGVAVMAVMLMPKKYRTLGVIAGAVGVAVLSIVAQFGGTGRSISIEGGRDRLDLWSDGLGYIKSSPIWGVGYERFPDLAGLTAHNSFLLCASELGFVGYLLWLSLLIFSLRQLWIIQQVPVSDEQGVELQRWARALTISLCVYMATGFFLSQTYHAGLYLLLGITAAIASIHAERTRSTEIAPGGVWWLRWAVATCFGSLFLIYVMVRSRSF